MLNLFQGTYSFVGEKLLLGVDFCRTSPPLRILYMEGFNLKQLFNMLAVCIGAIAGFLWGELDGMIITLIAMVSMDYITGVISAVKNRELSSRTGFNGILRKIVIFLVSAVANIIDTQVLKANGVLRNAVICYFIANEGISLLENAAKMGIPINTRLLSILKQIKNENEEK